jgi:hypothetical protein
MIPVVTAIVFCSQVQRSCQGSDTIVEWVYAKRLSYNLKYCKHLLGKIKMTCSTVWPCIIEVWEKCDNVKFVRGRF